MNVFLHWVLFGMMMWLLECILQTRSSCPRVVFIMGMLTECCCVLSVLVVFEFEWGLVFKLTCWTFTYRNNSESPSLSWNHRSCLRMVDLWWFMHCEQTPPKQQQKHPLESFSIHLIFFNVFIWMRQCSFLIKSNTVCFSKPLVPEYNCHKNLYMSKVKSLDMWTEFMFAWHCKRVQEFFLRGFPSVQLVFFRV